MEFTEAESNMNDLVCVTFFMYIKFFLELVSVFSLVVFLTKFENYCQHHIIFLHLFLGERISAVSRSNC
jgi:hypothetical protein